MICAIPSSRSSPDNTEPQKQRPGQAVARPGLFTFGLSYEFQCESRWVLISREASYEFTIALRLFSGMTRTFLLAGLALKVIFSPVNGLMPSRAFVAGFFTTFIFSTHER